MPPRRSPPTQSQELNLSRRVSYLIPAHALIHRESQSLCVNFANQLTTTHLRRQHPRPLPHHGLGKCWEQEGRFPVLVDDGFRKTLKRPRRSSTTGNEDPHVWPPKRSKRDSGNVQDDDMDIDDAEPDKAKTIALPATRIYAPPSRIQTSAVPRPVQVNAVASSSTSRLPPPLSPKSSKNIQQTKEFVADQTIPSKHPSYQARKSASHNDLAVQQVVQPVKSAVLPAAAIPISRTSSTFTLPTGALSDTDPFMGKASDKAKGKARAFTVLNNDPPLRIDLHKQLQRRLTATSGSISASRSGTRLPSSLCLLRTQFARKRPGPPVPRTMADAYRRSQIPRCRVPGGGTPGDGARARANCGDAWA